MITIRQKTPGEETITAQGENISSAVVAFRKLFEPYLIECFGDDSDLKPLLRHLRSCKTLDALAAFMADIETPLTIDID